MVLVLPNRLYSWMDARDPPLVCDCSGVADPDLGTVEAIARLRLGVRRRGEELSLERVPPDLRELLVLVGIEDLLCGSRVEVVGEPEEREQVRGVEEEADARDAVLRDVDDLE
jgi:ABC-type transporter Mla MlaB component